MSQLNNPQVEPYKLFKGTITEQVPKLIQEDRRIISPSLFFWRNLEVANAYLDAVKRGDDEEIAKWKKVMDNWTGTHVDTGFSVFGCPGKMYKIGSDSKHLETLSPSTQLSRCGLAIVTYGAFDAIESELYTQEEIKKYGNRSLTLEQALNNPFLARFIPDEALRNAAIKYFFLQGKYDKMMGVFFPCSEENPVMGIWRFWKLNKMAGAYGWGDLSSKTGRLVGTQPDVKVGDVQTLEHIMEAIQTKTRVIA